MGLCARRRCSRLNAQVADGLGAPSSHDQPRLYGSRPSRTWRATQHVEHSCLRAIALASSSQQGWSLRFASSAARHARARRVPCTRTLPRHVPASHDAASLSACHACSLPLARRSSRHARSRLARTRGRRCACARAPPARSLAPLGVHYLPRLERPSLVLAGSVFMVGLLFFDWASGRWD